jgi:adenine-specific DNA-methyltransferase
MIIEKIEKKDNLSQSANIVQNNINKLKTLFPEIVTEGKIDFNVLQEVLGKNLEEAEEYYRFTWAGKAQARREAHKRSTGTLRPAKEESLDWDTTQNMYIEGDNLEVLKLMQKSYAGKIKMIYIDPPYNTGKDFVYKDNYKDNLKNYQEVTGQVDSEGNKTGTNSDSDGRYHSNWLNMMYPRLQLARNLLKDDGVIFISIDDNEVDNLKKLCNEVFGESNFVANLVRKRRDSQANLSKNISPIHEYIFIYGKKNDEILNKISPDLNEDDFKNPDNDKRGPYVTMPCTNKGGGKYEVTLPNGRKITDEWRFKKETFQKLLDDNMIVVPRGGEGKPRYKLFLTEKKEKGVLANTWLNKLPSNQEGSREIKDLFGEIIFDTPKPVGLIKFLINLSTSRDSIILDFFSGSSSTADAVIQRNIEDSGCRKFINVQLPEKLEIKESFDNLNFKTISEIGKERIRRVVKKIKEEHPEKSKEIDLGFKVFKLDSSNIKSWDGNPENLETSLFDAVGNIKTDRTEEDVLYEILLKYGLDLTLPIEEKTIEGKKVFNVGLGSLFICLADDITAKVAEGIGQWKEACSPEICRVIFKDNGFTDVEKTNSVQTLKRYGINEIRSI